MRRWTLGVAIAGFVLAVLMIITLIVFWNVYIVGDFRTIKELSQSLESTRIPASASHDAGARWAVLATGSVFFTLILVALSLFFSSYLVNRRYRSFQTDWINMTTHELKLPIANVQLFAQTLQRPNLSKEDRARFLSLILQETRRLDQLVSRLLQARRLEGRMQELRLERVDLREWIGEYAQRPSSPGFLLHDGPTAKLRIDRGLMESVLDNLLQNALKYGNGSNPEVRTNRTGSWISVEVVDRGLGVPAKYRKRIFHRFFRIPSRELRRLTGSGLGLYIACASLQML